MASFHVISAGKPLLIRHLTWNASFISSDTVMSLIEDNRSGYGSDLLQQNILQYSDNNVNT